MSESKEEKLPVKAKEKKTLIAQKDFSCQFGKMSEGMTQVNIKKGDDLSKKDYPQFFINSLKTEGVLKG